VSLVRVTINPLCPGFSKIEPVGMSADQKGPALVRLPKARLVDDGLNLPWLDLDPKYVKQVRIDRQRIVDVLRIVGSSGVALDWLRDWSLGPTGPEGWHRAKEANLARPDRPWDRVAALDPHRTRGIDLREFNGAFFIVNGQHRVARARRLGLSRMMADAVYVHALKSRVPKVVRELWARLGRWPSE
jgi:hypothetical protein